MMNSTTGLISNSNQNLWRIGRDRTPEEGRYSPNSRLGGTVDMTTLTAKSPSKKILNNKKPTESNFSRKNS